MQKNTESTSEPSGKKAFVTHLVFDNSKMVYTIIYKKVKNKEIAEEIYQNVFCKAAENADLLKERSKDMRKAWLIIVASNACASYYRENQPGKFVSIDDDDEVTRDQYAPSLDKTIAHGDIYLRKAILDGYQYLLKAKPEAAIVFEMIDCQGMSGKEAAAALDVPEGTIKSRLHAARGFLQRFLNNRGIHSKIE